jgi:hypothetical protein
MQVIQTEPLKQSEWKLATQAFGRPWEFAWTATNLTVRCLSPLFSSHSQPTLASQGRASRAVVGSPRVSPSFADDAVSASPTALILVRATELLLEPFVALIYAS